MAMNNSFDISGLTKCQRKIFTDNNRFRIVVAGRRFGKTVLSISECLYEAQRGPKRLIWYIAPTYRMAKDLVWEELKDAIPPGMVLNKNESELSITLNGTKSKIVLKGADNPDSLRGKGLNFVVFDEAADIDEDTWFKVIYPALADKKGKALFIGTPKGYNWLYDLFCYAERTKGWSAYSFTTEQGGNVSIEELKYAKATMNDKDYKQEFLASFETLSNTVYSAFSRANNVCNSVEDYDLELLIGMDFNVCPMSAVIGSRLGNQLHIFDEIEINNGNTEEMCEEIIRRYGTEREYKIYPDPSGKARKTSAPMGQTDHSILKSYGFQVISPNRAPAVKDRINEVNALCLNANNESRLFISSSCTSLVKCLDGLTYKDKTSNVDKTLGLDHLPDGLGYLVHMEFPIIKREFIETRLQGL